MENKKKNRFLLTAAMITGFAFMQTSMSTKAAGFSVINQCPPGDNISFIISSYGNNCSQAPDLNELLQQAGIILPENSWFNNACGEKSCITGNRIIIPAPDCNNSSICNNILPETPQKEPETVLQDEPADIFEDKQETLADNGLIKGSDTKNENESQTKLEIVPETNSEAPAQTAVKAEPQATTKICIPDCGKIPVQMSGCNPKIGTCIRLCNVSTECGSTLLNNMRQNLCNNYCLFDTCSDSDKEGQASESSVTNTPVPDSTPDASAIVTENSTDFSGYALRIVELVNTERAKAGLNPVTLDINVTNAAQIRALETVSAFSHTRPDGRSCFTVLKETGVVYRGAGENIAYGQKTPEEVMNGWMNSSGHRANILNPSFTKLGVGFYEAANGIRYWTQMFIY